MSADTAAPQTPAPEKPVPPAAPAQPAVRVVQSPTQPRNKIEVEHWSDGTALLVTFNHFGHEPHRARLSKRVALELAAILQEEAAKLA